MDEHKPYFSTWSSQADSVGFDVVSASNDEFVLGDGSTVYDFLSTSFQTNFGHSNSAIIERIQRQLLKLPIAPPKASFQLKSNATNQLLALLGREDGRIFYTVSGAEAVENALKIARQVKNRKKIMARQRSYHGATLGALSVTGDWRNQPHFTCDRETVRIPEPQDDPSCEKLKQLMHGHRDTIAAVIVETITGANGVFIPPDRWFNGVQELCNEFGVFLILDEVLAGFGRTGKPFAFQHYKDLKPDMICMAKGISGGYVPLGAMWTSQGIADYYEDRVLACGLTNYAHPLGLAAMEGVMETLNNDDFKSNLNACETLFAKRIESIGQQPIVKETRVKGMLAALDFDCEAPTWNMGLRHGLHFYGRGKTNILSPPLTTTPKMLAAAFDRYEGLIKSFKF